MSAELADNFLENKSHQRQETIAVTDTFTAELLAESLTLWLQALEIPSDVKFAA